MDLKLNRYLVAGDVHLDGPTIHQVGAAFAGYPDLDRSYFLPAGGTPQPRDVLRSRLGAPDDRAASSRATRSTFPTSPASGRTSRPTACASCPRPTRCSHDAQIYTAGVYLPVPRYVVTFAANSHFFENTFFGGEFDVGVPFNGSAHSLTALHLRNDPYNGTYLAFDQHFVWDQDWIAFGVDPLTQQERQYNLVAYKRWTPKLESRICSCKSRPRRPGSSTGRPTRPASPRSRSAAAFAART